VSSRGSLRSDHYLPLDHGSGVHLTTGAEDPNNLTADGYDVTFMTNVVGEPISLRSVHPLLTGTQLLSRPFLPDAAVTASAA
jgi:hypothetical protein